MVSRFVAAVERVAAEVDAELTTPEPAPARGMEAG
jgi:hypothetical protein